jgi:hypothetical protein
MTFLLSVNLYIFIVIYCLSYNITLIILHLIVLLLREADNDGVGIVSSWHVVSVRGFDKYFRLFPSHWCLNLMAK